MKLTFLGANHEVTGSCTLLNTGKANILIDCGMEQGENTFKNVDLPVAANMIDYVFLTHAHIDHSGNLPLLYKNGFRGTVFATNETCSLCDIMLRDSAHIQMSEAEYRSRKATRAGKEAVEPIYNLDDVAGLLNLMRPCEYRQKIQVNENIIIRFTDIGHLLGSACIEIWIKEGNIEKKIVFSGDVGNINQPIIRDPQQVDGADYLVIESTYGNRLHGEREDYVKALAGCIQRTLDRGGNVIIPAFAVGRTQEILYFIREIKTSKLVSGHDGFPVYVDSPLANEATSIFMQCGMDCLDDDTRALMAQGINPLVFDGLNTYVTTEESKALNFDTTPKVIISASGMCDAGRIRHHLKNNLWRKESLILFVGYQAKGTLGRILLEGAKSVKLFGDSIAVNAELATLPGISGHADKNGLIDWVNGFSNKPSQIFVNHGDEQSCEEFTRCLSEEYGYNAFAPYSGTEYDLATGEFVNITAGVRIEKKTSPKHRPEAEHLINAAKQLDEIVEKCDNMANRDLRRLTEEIEKLIEKWK